jgi:hypothetical protein
MDWWRAVANKAMNLPVSSKIMNLLTERLITLKEWLRSMELVS